MQQKILWLASIMLGLLPMAASPQHAAAAVVMNYGASGNDYYRFTTPSMAFIKASGFTTLIPFAMHVNPDGTLMIGGGACASNGVYTGPTNWNSLVAAVKTPPTTVTRYEVCIGGWTDTSYDNIKSLVNTQGTGPGSILYKNFQALKNAVPGIDAINDDDEQTYDLRSSTNFANMLGGLGYKFTLAPYTSQSFWVNLKNGITNCDNIYLQCYAGGAGNDPGQWNAAFGHGVVVIPGQESNTAIPATFRSWHLATGVDGGFYYPDAVFSTTYWSAAIIEANGAVPAAPTGLTAAQGGEQVSLAWNMVPGAISYNVKRSTSSGGETTIASVSTANKNWPASNQYTDPGLADGTTYYYKVSAVNTNGESLDSAEVNATPQPSMVSNFGFETPSVGSGNYQYNPSGATWTFNGASPNGSGIIANGSAFGNPSALQGVQAAFVQQYGTISRAISGFIPGTNYTILYLAAERSGNAQSWNVTIDGTVIGSYNPGSTATSYSQYSATFTATATTHTLAFVGTDLATGDNTVFIDDVQITAPPLPVFMLTNTLPVTAADVVGSKVIFMAAFASASPLACQWQVLKSGTTNNIPGATNTTLTLSNLQLTNTASYRLYASNVLGSAVSAASSLIVSSVPAAVNNIISAYAAQTGPGSASPVTNFVPTWTVAPGSLIAGQSPSSVGGGIFNNYNSGSVAVLTDGTSGWLNYWPGVGSSPTAVTCGTVAGGAGQSVTYTLTGSANGYNLTNITVYGGWGDNGRDQQAYTIYYSKVAAPAAFISLSSVNYNPANASSVQCATRATLMPANGVLATNVAAVKFDFTNPAGENGYEGYSEIGLYGTPTPVPPSTNPTNITFQIAANILILNWPSDHIGWRLQVQTNDLTQGMGTSWFDVPGSTVTNEMFFPVNLINGSVFYRLAY
ncbi:MAG TPA: fibronectin type III domain-containing protein [Verrucomicrobiae bacterium]|nr:fibronectin type III domain-containing protein [Verrucomicrobiae bacterium]